MPAAFHQSLDTPRLLDVSNLNAMNTLSGDGYQRAGETGLQVYPSGRLLAGWSALRNKPLNKRDQSGEAVDLTFGGTQGKHSQSIITLYLLFHPASRRSVQNQVRYVRLKFHL